MVAHARDLDALVRSARAGVANVRLQLRSVQADLERVEHTSGGGDRAATRDLLGARLAEQLERRRRELADDLERARQEAALVIANAREEAAAIIAARQRATSALTTCKSAAAGAPLRVEPPVEEPPVDDPPSEPHHEVDAQPEPLEQLSGVEREQTPADAPEAVAPPALPLAAPTTLAAAVPAPEYLAQVVQAAVTASLASLGATRAAPGPNRVVARAPLRRRLLHLDVVLPLVAISVVLIVLLAWVS